MNWKIREQTLQAEKYYIKGKQFLSWLAQCGLEGIVLNLTYDLVSNLGSST